MNQVQSQHLTVRGRSAIADWELRDNLPQSGLAFTHFPPYPDGLLLGVTTLSTGLAEIRES